MPLAASWSSTWPTIATVGSVGDSAVVTATGLGTARIIGSFGIHADTATVDVVRAGGGDNQLKVVPGDFSLPRPLTTQELSVEGGVGEVTWESRDTTVAIILPEGLVIGIREGRTQIVATDLVGGFAEANVRVSDPERAALVAFYHAMGGDNWVRNDNWLSDRPHWSFPGWYGVIPHAVLDTSFVDGDPTPPPMSLIFGGQTPTTEAIPTYEELHARWRDLPPLDFDNFDIETDRDRFGRIAIIGFGGNNLVGALPSEIGVLKALTVLELGSNSITSLPTALGTLPLLAILHVNDNLLTGALPDLSNTSVGFLDVNRNRLTSLAGGLGAPFLLAMNLERNLLAGTLPDLPSSHPFMFGASWLENDGLCHADTPAIQSWLTPNPNELRQVKGPRCGVADGKLAYLVTNLSTATFDAIGDSVELVISAYDVNWNKKAIPVTAFSTSALQALFDPAAQPVTTVTSSASGHFIKSVGNGDDTIVMQATENDTTTKVYDPVAMDSIFAADTASWAMRASVQQVAAALSAPADTSFAAESIGRVDISAVDRNGNPGAPSGPIRSTSSSPSVAVAYRNGVVAAKTAGTTTIDYWSVTPQGLRITTSVDVTVTAVATGTTPAITSVTPNPLVSGQPASIKGTDLGDATTATVLIDGEIVPIVTAVADTLLTLTVPQTNVCDPGRNVAVVVQRGARADSYLLPLKEVGDDLTLSNMAVGDIIGPTEIDAVTGLCIQTEAGSDVEYLLGLQGVYESATNADDDPSLGILFEVGSQIVVDDGAPANIVPRVAASQEDMDIRRRHEVEEQRFRDAEAEVLRTLPRGTGTMLAAARAPVIDSTTTVGDTVEFRYPGPTRFCGPDFHRLPSEIMVVGERVVIARDLGNPTGYSRESYQEFARDLDTVIYPALIDYFGEPTDVNDDGRITILFTHHVNQAGGGGILGWVSPVQLLKNDSTAVAEDEYYCQSSNEMEIFFGRLPDDQIGENQMLGVMPALIAHESTHLIQGRRFDKTQTARTGLGVMRWLAEAQAVLGEEVVGHVVLGNEPGQNYGADKINSRGGRTWYRGQFRAFRNYFRNPGQCNWWVADSSPCGGRPLFYDVGWSFMRWMSDQYGPGYTGGESQMHKDIIDSTATNEWAVLSAVTGDSFEHMLSRWGAALYLDDRATDSSVQFTSWNLPEVFEAVGAALDPIAIGLDEGVASTFVTVSSTDYTLLREQDAFEASAVGLFGKRAGSHTAPRLPSLKLMLFVYRVR